jgi:glycosyltransferase involved in cell wall biosynthesis
MAYGMAIASTAVGGIPEVLEDGEEGLLVPSEDPAALADALCRLAADAPLRERLATNALRRAKRLDEVEVSNRLTTVYESLG